jgi:site-specific DNA-methyltransferase (cytosine-N4-specific)
MCPARVNQRVRAALQIPRISRDPSHIESALSAIPWNFEDADAGRQSIHAFHSYPARFIPEIPRALIQDLPPPTGTLVFDPFCGCGTTLVEAQSAGYGSVGVDLNPIGCLVARIKTTPLPDDFADEVECCIARALAMSQPVVPEIPNLHHWFTPEVALTLARLRAAISAVQRASVRQGLEGVFSSIVVRVSRQDSDTRYAAVEKNVSVEDVYQAFRQAGRSLANLSLSDELWERPSATIQSP